MGKVNPSKRFAEFFAGIGLVHEALRGSGWECVYANDIDAKKEAMYKGHFGDSPYFHREDVWETERIVAGMAERPFLATASFPCTDLSLAGRWQGFEGDQSSTYFGFIRALRALNADKPKLVMLENVTGFLTSKDGADFVRAVTTLAGEGYWIDSVVLDAKAFVPQSRPRVFVVGFHDSLHSSRIIRQGNGGLFGDGWQAAIDEGGSLRPDSLLRLMAKTRLPTGWATVALRPPKQAEYSLRSVIDTDDEQSWWDGAATKKHYAMLSDLHRTEVERRRKSGGLHVGTVYRRCRYDEMRAEVRFDNLAGCLRTPRGGSARQIVMVIDDGRVRFRWMSPREYARLQGAPDFTLAENTIQSLFGFGDGVCVPVIRWMDQNILTPLFEDALTRESAGKSGEISKKATV
ncbi:MAG: DNA (cytosine-5-)-methyltransferase [Phycisphaeraceae bacterium]|nr:DNA (cytosine-5-)-methyltransferase [Phycisphaeraceae bacterium]